MLSNNNEKGWSKEKRSGRMLGANRAATDAHSDNDAASALTIALKQPDAVIVLETTQSPNGGVGETGRERRGRLLVKVASGTVDRK